MERKYYFENLSFVSQLDVRLVSLSCVFVSLREGLRLDVRLVSLSCVFGLLTRGA